jgi:hypothetical protein
MLIKSRNIQIKKGKYWISVCEIIISLTRLNAFHLQYNV